MSQLKLILLALLLKFAKASIPQAHTPTEVIRIPQGELIGTVLQSRDGRDFNQFLGVPFGKITKRFQVAKLADGWTGIRNASEFGPICLQLDWMTGKAAGSEDCLSLNIYTPKLSKTAQLTVMVFFHGGGWVMGTPTIYGPLFFMDEDVVLVTVNYRLGAFGFLNTGTPDAQGNMGLKDNVLALQWIQKNIEHFGGNKNNVNIFGVSAGAASVSYLVLSPLARGLFHTAISESGNALCPYSLSPSAVTNSKKLGHFMDCPTSSMERLTQCLIAANGTDIVNNLGSEGFMDFIKDRGLPKMVPSIETPEPEDVENAFLTKTPFEILTSGDFNRVPWMTGVNSHEGLSVAGAGIFADPALRDLVNKEFGRVLPFMHYYDNSADDPCTVTTAIRDFYFQGERNLTLENAKDDFTNLHSDRWFFHCTQEASLLYAKYAPTYLYYFSRIGQNGPPSHGEELQYLFSGQGYSYVPIEPTPEFIQFSKSMVKIWTSFAKTGKPNLENFMDLPLESIPEWTPVDPVEDSPHPKYYYLDNLPKFEKQSLDFAKRIEFWQSMPLNEPFCNKCKAFSSEIKRRLELYLNIYFMWLRRLKI